jgi:hypothetical protein
MLYQDHILTFFESTIEKLMNNDKSSQKNNSEIFDNILIEIISIIKRYFSHTHSNSKQNNGEEKDQNKLIQNEFIEKIINETKLFDQMIFLLNRENLTILKLLHYISISVIKS